MIYCISDIHGEYALFQKLMNKVGFNKNDTLIVLGDIIDKGTESVRLLRVLLPNPNCKIILGNHEYDFLKYYHGLMQQTENDFDGVLRKLQEYFPYDGRLLTWELVDMLENLPSYLEFDNFLCVHAGVPLDENGEVKDVSGALTEELVYDRKFKEPNVLPNSSKCVLYGHTPTRYIKNGDEFIFYPRGGGQSGNSENIEDYCKIHLDTGVYLSGVLGCLRIDDCKAFYVSK